MIYNLLFETKSYFSKRFFTDFKHQVMCFLNRNDEKDSSCILTPKKSMVFRLEQRLKQNNKWFFGPDSKIQIQNGKF